MSWHTFRYYHCEEKAMKIDNKKFASDYAEIMRLTDLEMYARAHTEVKRVLKNHLSIDFDGLNTYSIDTFTALFNNIHDAETFYIAGEILKYAAAVLEKLEENDAAKDCLEKALYLFIQAISANDPSIKNVAEMGLCEISLNIDMTQLPEVLYTKLEVLDIQCKLIPKIETADVEV